MKIQDLWHNNKNLIIMPLTLIEKIAAPCP